MLDPARLTGQGPATSDYRAAGVPAAHQDAYLRFPSTPLGRVGPPQSNGIESFTRHSGEAVLRLHISQDPSDETGSTPRILVQMDRSLHPLGVGVNDTFARRADTLVQQGCLDAVPGPSAFERFRQQIQYWTDDGWVNTAAWPGLSGAPDTTSPDSTSCRD